MRPYSSILETMGKTPLVRLHKIEEKYGLKTRLYAKLEAFNPTNSVKMRPAYFMMRELYARKIINHESTIIEATSGNTGIALAMIGTYYGNKVILCMPDTLSKERIDQMKMYGAKIILTEGAKGINASKEKAVELNNKIENSAIPSQFTNEQNPESHYETTGPEIELALEGKVDYVFAGIGTGGTITGLGMYFKQKDDTIKIIGVEPVNSPIITKGKAGKHKIQGIGAGFIPEILNLNFVDEVITVSDEAAYQMTKSLPIIEGISAGISAGAAMVATLDYVNKNKLEDKNVVVIFPDSGEKYFSTGVFE